MRGSPSSRPSLVSVLLLLTATGWAANHFSALIPAYADREGLSTALLDAVFGVYAVGLLPGLFGGGALSDRFGRPWVVLPGASLAALGTVVLLLDHGSAGLLIGRLVVGLGAGLAFGAGTAWAADLGGATGTVLAGVFLTTGFGLGPFVSGVLAEWAPGPLRTPFAVSLAVSIVAVAAALLIAVPATPRVTSRTPAPAEPHQSTARALAWSAPVGVLVFASAAMAIVTVPPRLPDRYDGPLLVGVACAVTLGTGIVVQTLVRRAAAGPRTGVVGTVAGAVGFGLVAVAGGDIGLPLFVVLCVLFGTTYGLCLREGLLDVETLAPPARRGLITGIYYVVTYLGFGLPLLLVALQPAFGATVPVVAVAVVAAAMAVLRSAQLAGGHPGR